MEDSYKVYQTLMQTHLGEASLMYYGPDRAKALSVWNDCVSRDCLVATCTEYSASGTRQIALHHHREPKG